MKKATRACWRICFFAGIFLGQLIVIGISLNLVCILHGGIVLIDKHLYKGNIFFTGEINGAIESNGCDNQGSASRRAHILKKYRDYLYFDMGNISSVSPKVNVFLINSFRNLDVTAINLTKGDITNIGTNNIAREADMFISANIEHHQIAKYKKEMLVLKNQENEQINLKVFVTGIAGRNNIPGGPSSYLADMKKEIMLSINELCGHAKDADIKILLFNSQLFILEEILSKAKIRFDLVVCQSSPDSIPNNTIRINGIPIIYPDRYGRSLASVFVRYAHNKKYYEIEYIRLYRKMPRDAQTDEAIMRTMAK